MTMNRRDSMGAIAALGMGAMAGNAMAGQQQGGAEPNSLVVVWTSGDPDVAHRMALMYTHAAKRAGWFEHVTLIIWGPSQRRLMGDKDLKAKITEMKADGVVVEACIACARTYGLVEGLKELGLPVFGQGEPLSKALKDPMVCVATY